MIASPEPAPRPWSIETRQGQFADGSPVCLIKDANGRVVAYDLGYPEARFILKAIALSDSMTGSTQPTEGAQS